MLLVLSMLMTENEKSKHKKIKIVQTQTKSIDLHLIYKTIHTILCLTLYLLSINFENFTFYTPWSRLLFGNKTKNEIHVAERHQLIASNVKFPPFVKDFYLFIVSTNIHKYLAKFNSYSKIYDSTIYINLVNGHTQKSRKHLIVCATFFKFLSNVTLSTTKVISSSPPLVLVWSRVDPISGLETIRESSAPQWSRNVFPRTN